MWNPGDDRNRLIEVLTPGEGDAFFRDIVQLAPDASRAEFEAISARHGIRWFDDWTAYLRSRHGLRE